MIWLARTFMWRNGGFPVTGHFPKEGSILYVSGMVVPKNAPDKDAAYKYMNAMLEPRRSRGSRPIWATCRRSTTRLFPAT